MEGVDLAVCPPPEPGLGGVEMGVHPRRDAAQDEAFQEFGEAWEEGDGAVIRVDPHVARFEEGGDNARAPHRGGHLPAADEFEWGALRLASIGGGDDHDEEDVAIPGRGDDDKGDASGSAYIYAHDGSDWVHEAKLVPTDGATVDNFGESVAIYGDKVIVGAYIAK